jgi:hypothetical protein
VTGQEASQLEGYREMSSGRVDQHHELRVPVPLAPHVTKGGSPEGHRSAHVLHIDDDSAEMQITY